MIYTGFYIILVLLLSNLYKSIKLNLGILIGIIIPDLIIFFNYFTDQSSSHGSISHSIIFILTIYIFLLMINELLSNKLNNKIINGILIGMLLHLIFDIILSIGTINFYWPLPLKPIEPLYDFSFHYSYMSLIASFQFLILRLFGYKILIKLISAEGISNNCYKNIKTISSWMTLQTIYIFLFLFLFLLDIELPIGLINFCLLTSLFIAVYFLYSIKDITTEEIIIG